MNETRNRLTTSRRTFLKNAGQVAAASALVGMVVPHVHAEGEQHDPHRAGRLRGTRDRRRGQRA